MKLKTLIFHRPTSVKKFIIALGMTKPNVHCVINLERDTHFRTTRVHSAQATHEYCVYALQFPTKIMNSSIHNPMLLWLHFEMQLACDCSESNNNE